MDRTEVAAYYRGKGYQVHESIVVTGKAGNELRVPLLCEGPLGNLVVFFGDAGGIDGHEIGSAKRIARDLGATAVVAAATFTSAQRLTAADLGVVLVDDGLLRGAQPEARPVSTWPGAAPGDLLRADLAAHPWPDSGRPGGRDTTPVALTDIDQVLGHRDAPAPRTATPAAVAPVSRERSDDGGLWKSGTPAQVAVARKSNAPQLAATRFAWLSLPPEPTVPPEVEIAGTVQARPAAKPLTAEQLEAERMARMHRQAQMRVVTRRGAWILGGAVAVYLFLLWWF